MKKGDQIIIIPSLEGLSTLRPTAPPPALHPKEGLRIETTDTHPNIFPQPRAVRNQVAALSSVYLFPFFFFFSAFQETIIIQIIAVIYSAIRAARCGGRGAETDGG